MNGPPINLVDLPGVLFWKIVQKLSPAEYIKLHQTCSEVHEYLLANKNFIFLSNLHLEITAPNNIQIFSFYPRKSMSYESFREEFQCFRLNARQCVMSTSISLNTETLQQLIRMVDELKLTCMRLDDLEAIVSPLFITFLEKVKPKRLSISAVSQNILPPSTFDNIESISLGVTDYDNAQLAAMPQSEITMICSRVTSQGIVDFIMQWFNGARSIRKVDIQLLEMISVANIVAHLPANLLYTSLSHPDSILSRLPQLPFDERLRENSIFVLWKPDDIYNQLILDIGENSVLIEVTANPVNYIFKLLLDWEFSAITRRCPTCGLAPDECNCNYE